MNAKSLILSILRWVGLVTHHTKTFLEGHVGWKIRLQEKRINQPKSTILRVYSQFQCRPSLYSEIFYCGSRHIDFASDRDYWKRHTVSSASRWQITIEQVTISFSRTSVRILTRGMVKAISSNVSESTRILKTVFMVKRCR